MSDTHPFSEADAQGIRLPRQTSGGAGVHHTTTMTTLQQADRAFYVNFAMIGLCCTGFIIGRLGLWQRCRHHAVAFEYQN
jgi:hypothetical protein